ncbi:MAG: indole-3-glycerol phosphate synthase TrpC [Alphaproteobacteria bacterium]|nr:indole-3-glycerol phosphate synthase TrpC [Alphaproteobacteria bacterium]
MSGDTLARILKVKREEVTSRRNKMPLGRLVEMAKRETAPARGFLKALDARALLGQTGLIAEIKRASPSKGLIRSDFDPEALARNFKRGGATCLSVLTDRSFFKGDDLHLANARNSVLLPVLRKDFMVDPYQIAETRILGADCVLLIVAALSDAQAAEMESAARDFGMDVLVEVHDAAELARALKLKSRLIGINNRDLKTMTVDLATAETLAKQVPKDRLVVAESGISAAADIARLKRVGIHCFLVGESLMRQDDVFLATRALLS